MIVFNFGKRAVLTFQKDEKNLIKKNLGCAKRDGALKAWLTLGPLMRLCQPPDGNTSPKYKLLCFITTKFFLQREERTSF